MEGSLDDGKIEMVVEGREGVVTVKFLHFALNSSDSEVNPDIDN